MSDPIEAAARAIVAAEMAAEKLGELTDERWADMLSDWRASEDWMRSAYRVDRAFRYVRAAIPAYLKARMAATCPHPGFQHVLAALAAEFESG